MIFWRKWESFRSLQNKGRGFLQGPKADNLIYGADSTLSVPTQQVFAGRMGGVGVGMSFNGSKANTGAGAVDSQRPCGLSLQSIESLIDDFETHWPQHSGQKLGHFAEEWKLLQDVAVLTELVRVDIDRRYGAGLPVELELYWEVFPQIRSDRRASLAVAFEDYRSRAAAGLSLPLERWSGLDGIDEATWFRQLNSRSQIVAVSTRPTATKRFSIHCVEKAGFAIVGRIGEGALSEVFLATQHDLAHRHVVLKVVDRPLSEPHQMARLQHTNIVPIYSFHQVESHSILCMPYAGMLTLAGYLATSRQVSERTGHSLVATLKRQLDETQVHLLDQAETTQQSISKSRNDVRDELGGRFPKPNWDKQAFDEVAAKRPLEGLAAYDCCRLPLLLFSKLASALAHAHDRGVLHGDLKPANVLIRNDGEPALLDFNLSVAIDGKNSQWAGGTLAYMSPEMMRALMGQRVQPERTSDIYGLGVMLFEFLNGELPYCPPKSCASVDLEEGLRVRQGKLRWSNPNVSSGTRAIVGRCLTPKAGDRYQSADQLQEDLVCELHDLPLRHLQEPTVGSRLRKWIRRHPRLCSSTAVASVFVLVISILSLASREILEANRRYSAEEHFERFLDNSSRCVADLLMPATVESKAAIAESDRLLDSYHLLSDDRWITRPEWSNLAREQTNSLEIRIADLLVRSLTRRIDHFNSPAEGTHSDLEMIARRLKLLKHENFERHAPVSSNRLHNAVERIVAGQSTVAGRSLEVPSPPAELANIDRLATALERITKNRPREALEILMPSMLESIDPFSYWIVVGQAQAADGQLRAAELSFTLAIRELQDAPAGHYHRGVCRRRIGGPHDLQGAESDFSRVLAIEPTRDEARIERALVREVQRDYAGAVSDLNAVMKGGKHVTRSLIQRSRVYSKLGRLDDARRDLDAAVRHTPQAAADFLSRGFSRIATDPAGALEDFRQAESLEPESVVALQNQAFLLAEHFGREDAARESLTRLLNIAPTFEPAIMGRAVLRARSGDRDGAIQDLQSAESQADLSPASLYQAACVYALLTPSSDAEAAVDAESRCFHYLSRAIRRGYGGDVLSTDPDLDSIRDDNRYLAILETVRLSQTSTAE